MPSCKNCNQFFTIYPEDQKFYAKIGVPEPTECPDCRQQRRIGWRNFFNLYERKCELTGAKIISMFGPEPGYKVINPKDWYSDKWNPLDYGRDYDFSKSFFSQFAELYRAIPHMALIQLNCYNSDYCNIIGNAKGCYMMFGCVNSENCLYGHVVWQCHDCYDCLYLRKCELCYQAIDCDESYGLFYCSDCAGCNNCRYTYHCKGCQDCVGCYGLINQRNYVLNQPTANGDDFQVKAAAFMALGEKEKAARIAELKRTVPVKEREMVGAVNCSGNYIYHSKNCHDAYDVKDCEDCRYASSMEFHKDAYDVSFTAWRGELMYNNLTTHGRKMIGCHHCFSQTENLCYCQETNSVKDCFGCIGLHNKEQYCILNKKYSEGEYNSLKEKIIKQMTAAPASQHARDKSAGQVGEWGEFFPLADSPYSYNESIVNEYFPLTKEQATAKGYRWLDRNQREYQPQSYQMPADIKEVKDEILQEVLACVKCGRNYKLVKPELDFYRQYNLLAPTECFYCRNEARLAKRNPRKLFIRQCGFCGKEINTTYAPDRPEKVYCEECYRKEIY
ncbi:MAG: zinc-ribbon domain containing protein [Patescibacteria group bacterium]|jgi:hypothetical protein